MRENRLCVIPDGLLWVFIAFPLTRGNISGLMPAHYLHNSRHNGALLSLWTLPRLFNVFTQNQLPKGALYTSSEVKGESHSHSVQTHTHTSKSFHSPLSLSSTLSCFLPLAVLQQPKLDFSISRWGLPGCQAGYMCKVSVLVVTVSRDPYSDRNGVHK